MLECDLIMKGGITSGVVYPHAIAEIAQRYRLRSIGGTSAGAIAAAFAAAAEYRRQSSPHHDSQAGYELIGQLAHELGRDMQSLFQPSPPFRAVFALLMAFLHRREGQGVLAALLPTVLRRFWVCLAPALALGLLPALIGMTAGAGWVTAALLVPGLFLAALSFAALVVAVLAKTVREDLPAHDFGICPGLGQVNGCRAAFTDWIADKIDLIAGNGNAPADPLTVGQLKKFGIDIAAVTTDLSSGRPYHLPLQTRIHFFSEREFRRIFPGRIVDYLVRKGGTALRHQVEDLPDDLYQLPTGADFPVLLVARMSLSFPGLIQAVPLYRYDDQLDIPTERAAEKIRRCLFSDGGISSNFPIHFFDALLPKRPTFGISLGSWEQDRRDTGRISLPDAPRRSTDLAVKRIDGLGGFLGAILNTAKDWRDTLQSTLPGYAERIVEIRLDEASEGGMNLNMPEDTIAQLSEYGRQAGKCLVGQFNFDEHRYRRALALLPKLEDAFTQFADAYNQPAAGDYGRFLATYAPLSYSTPVAWRTASLIPFADAVAGLGRKQGAPPLSQQAGVPWADALIRLIATADRMPR